MLTIFAGKDLLPREGFKSQLPSLCTIWISSLWRLKRVDGGIQEEEEEGMLWYGGWKQVAEYHQLMLWYQDAKISINHSTLLRWQRANKQVTASSEHGIKSPITIHLHLHLHPLPAYTLPASSGWTRQNNGSTVYLFQARWATRYLLPG